MVGGWHVEVGQIPSGTMTRNLPTGVRGRTTAAAGLVMLAVAAGGAAVALHGCQGGKQRLVEVTDVGPPGGPRGPSEGYRWVGADEEPPPGKGWRTVDVNTLTAEERGRIR